MRDLKRKAKEFFGGTFFLGVAAGVAVTMLIPVPGDLFFSGGNSSGHEKRFNIHAEASSSPSAVLANYDWTVQSLDGQDFAMTRAKGEVVFLNFWATWCYPCVSEMASIQRLYKKFKGKGVFFSASQMKKPPK